MPNYLQEVLDEIEAEARENSAKAIAGAATIEAAYALRDRLRAEEQFEALVTPHYHYDRLDISIHVREELEDMLRIALAGLDIQAIESAGEQQVADGVFVRFNTPAKWFLAKAA